MKLHKILQRKENRSIKRSFNKSTSRIIDNSRAVRAFVSPGTDTDTYNSVIFMDCRTVTRFRQDIMCGENRLIKHSSLPASLADPRSPTGKGPTRPNFRGTAIMTVIFLHLEERAHFLPARPPSPVPSSPLFSLRRRRECPAPAILLKPTATIAPHPFFHPFFLSLFLSSAPRSFYSDTVKLEETIQRALTIKWDYSHVTWIHLRHAKVKLN